MQSIPISDTAMLVDVHTHVVPESFPNYIGKQISSQWPSMAPAPNPCHRHVMVAGSIYRTVTNQCWDCKVRTDDMNSSGVGLQVLSVMPELLGYWLSLEDSEVLCRYLNDVIARMVSDAPGKFLGLAAVPMQNIGSAIRELDFAINTLGMKGVEIGTNINGLPIGHPDLYPFFEAAESMGAAIFVHPLRPVGMDRLVGPASLEQIVAFPGETGLAAVSMITGGTFAKLPKLRIAYSHGGGSLSMLLPRLQHAWNTFPPVRQAVAMDPQVAARSMYYDNLVYDAATIHRLIDVFGVSQLMVGTDYPFTIMDADPVGRIQSLDLAESVQIQLKRDNALHWLGMT